jgi:hypothetical protein
VSCKENEGGREETYFIYTDMVASRKMRLEAVSHELYQSLPYQRPRRKGMHLYCIMYGAVQMPSRLQLAEVAKLAKLV